MPIIYNKLLKGGYGQKTHSPKDKHIFKKPTPPPQSPKIIAQNSAHNTHNHLIHLKVPTSTHPSLSKHGNQPYTNLKTGTLQRIRQRAQNLKQGVLSGARSVSRGAQIVSNAAITGAKFLTNVGAAPGRLVYRIGTAAAIAPGQIVHRSIDKIKEMRLKSINTKATNKLLGLEKNTSTDAYRQQYYKQQRASNKLALHQAVSKQRHDMVKGYLGNTSSIFAAKKSSENTQSLKNMILGRSKKINKVKLYNNLLHPTKKLSAVQEAAAAYEISKQANIIERNNNTKYSIRNKNGHRVINTTTGKKKTKLTIKQILENPAEIEKYSTYLHGQKILTSKQARILETLERQKIINAAKRREVYLEKNKPKLTNNAIPVVKNVATTVDLHAAANTSKLYDATATATKAAEDATARERAKVATIAANTAAAATKALDDATARARANAATKNMNKLILNNKSHLETESSSNNITQNKAPVVKTPVVATTAPEDAAPVVAPVVVKPVAATVVAPVVATVVAPVDAPVVGANVVAPVVETTVVASVVETPVVKTPEVVNPIEELTPEAESLYAELPSDSGYMDTDDIIGFEGQVNPSSPLTIEKTIHNTKQINTLNNNRNPDPDKILKQIEAEVEAESTYLEIGDSLKEIEKKKISKHKSNTKITNRRTSKNKNRNTSKQHRNSNRRNSNNSSTSSRTSSRKTRQNSKRGRANTTGYGGTGRGK